ncbi:MAG: MaoC family dehydratase N-terminal domain-containing protein [Aestuariivirga sp.]|nr:MaoC family dehydratase N-terminal domain-containing protein [Aestuariivirga sp.]
MTGEDVSQWVGRSEEAEDTVTPGPLERFAAMLDYRDRRFRPGDVIPPLSHWLFFLPRTPQSELGPDGHARRGDFIPALPEHPRRMWAGSRFSFLKDIRVGDELRRVSRIAAVTPKTGASGSMVFVTVRHELSRRDDEGPALIDEHDIVYRSLGGTAATASPRRAERGNWRRELTPDAVMLFRYSALTFNGHRIHYDRDYARTVEGYPGLVVHGPLIATLLVDLIGRNAPGARVRHFSFRALSPLFDGASMSVNASPPGADGKMALWAANAEEGLAMTAEAVIEASR